MRTPTTSRSGAGDPPAAGRAGRRHLTVAVLTGSPDRAAESTGALQEILPGVKTHFAALPDGRLPTHWEAAKEHLEDLARHCRPQLVLTHRVDDAHQDHRTLGVMVTTVWRDALVLHFEIPKWDGDMGAPSHYVGLTASTPAARWTCSTGTSRASTRTTGGRRGLPRADALARDGVPSSVRGGVPRVQGAGGGSEPMRVETGELATCCCPSNPAPRRSRVLHPHVRRRGGGRYGLDPAAFVQDSKSRLVDAGRCAGCTVAAARGGQARPLRTRRDPRRGRRRPARFSDVRAASGLPPG